MYRDRRARPGRLRAAGRDRRPHLRTGRLPLAAAANGHRAAPPRPLRWRSSVATAIRHCQHGRHALVCRWCRPWRRYGGVRPTIGRRLRCRSGGVGRSRRWLGAHRGAAAAGLAPRRRRGQCCHRRGAGAASPARGFLRGPRPRRLAAAAVERVAAEGPRGLLCGPRCRRRGAGTGARALQRRRHSGLLLRAPLRQRSRPARRPVLRLRRLARACLPAPTSAPAPRSPRVVALQAVLHQPLHEVPQRQVRVHVRQQCP